MPTPILLDTQVVLTAYFGDLKDLPRKVQFMLGDIDNDLLISTITMMEIATKNSIGKLKMGEAETQEAIRDLRLSVLPFDTRHAYRMFSLPLHHRDPFDRMIIATALGEDIPVIAADREFKKYKGLKVIW